MYFLNLKKLIINCLFSFDYNPFFLAKKGKSAAFCPLYKKSVLWYNICVAHSSVRRSSDAD